MRNYGLPYRGSKSRIARWVIDHIPPADTFVDLFAGGCAVTHAALLSGKYKHFIANDIEGMPQIFKDAINGEYANYSHVASRDEFMNTDDPVIKLLYSFGNDRRSYLWSPELEVVKVPAERMLSAPSMYERRMYYKQFIHALQDYLLKITDKDDLKKKMTGNDNSTGLQGLQGLEGLEVSQHDYRLVDIPEDSVVYADPPYRSTDKDGKGYTKEKFDFDGFDRWLASVPFPVIVSEYDAPPECIEIASIDKVSTMAAKTTIYKTEHLFIQTRFIDWYNEHKELELKDFVKGEK